MHPVNHKLVKRVVPGQAPFASFREFFRLEAAGGILLFVAAVFAMVLKNTPLDDAYSNLLMLPVQIRAGALDIDKPLVLWVNDGLMAIFFFLVAMEIKREILIGHLADWRSLVLPGLGAVGGMVVPAGIFVALNWGDNDALHGWAIPTTTDIAFALGVLALLGSRVPPALKVFLLTLAVLDDLAAIVIIALFYTSNLSVVSLVVGAIVIAGLACLNLKGVQRTAPYIWLGVILWVAVLKSGVHATLAGVVLGFAIPLGARTKTHDPELDEYSPLKHLIHEVHPWVAFAILPMFAFFNAGISFADFNPERLFHPVPVGIALGLFLGKPIGVMSFTFLAVKLGLTRLPDNTRWPHIIGVAFLCGIGFTMSIFLGSLAFQEGGSGYARADRLGIIVGSLLAGFVGFWLLRASLGKSSVNAPD